MCSHLVSVQTYNEEQMLYHLQNIQLGPSDDVSSNHIGKQFLFLVTRYLLITDMACVGVVRVYISGKILGKQQYGTQMFRVY